MNFYGLMDSDQSVSLMISGCRYKACAVPEVMAFDYGDQLTVGVAQQVIQKIKNTNVETLYLCGGDIFEPENFIGALRLLQHVKKVRPDIVVYTWTGYPIGSLLAIPLERELLGYVDVLVDHSSITPYLLDVQELLCIVWEAVS